MRNPEKYAVCLKRGLADYKNFLSTEIGRQAPGKKDGEHLVVYVRCEVEDCPFSYEVYTIVKDGKISSSRIAPYGECIKGN